MKYTTKTVSKSILRFLLISLSALTIASCSKNNDEVVPEEPISSIEFTNINNGDVIEEDTFVFETSVTTSSGVLEQAKVILTNTESGAIIEADLIGQIPEIDGEFTTTMHADVTVEEAGEYEAIAQFREDGPGEKKLIESETITISFDFEVEEE